MKAWKDATSYSQNDKEKKPVTFEAEHGPLRVTVTCGHIYYPGKWIMHCFSLNMKEVELKAKSREQAQQEALDLIARRLGYLNAALAHIGAVE
jgi:hypothetical protein